MRGEPVGPLFRPAGKERSAKIAYGISETIGLRDEMEDTHAIWDDASIPLFSAEVYDGHAGTRAAAIAAEMLTPYFLHGKKEEPQGRDWTEFSPEVLREAYLATDRAIVESATESGAAAATLYIREDRFLAANAGDARIVIGEGAGAISLTVDHKPDLPAERARVVALGGRVITFDVPRLQGLLAMSRSLGDAPLKPFVTAEPRVAEGFLGRGNDIAIVACDGIWDVLTSEEAVATARRAPDPQEAADLLRATALERGSTDNISVIVLDLKGYTASCEAEGLRISRILDRALEPA